MMGGQRLATVWRTLIPLAPVQLEVQRDYQGAVIRRNLAKQWTLHEIINLAPPAGRTQALGGAADSYKPLAEGKQRNRIIACRGIYHPACDVHFGTQNGQGHADVRVTGSEKKRHRDIDQ